MNLFEEDRDDRADNARNQHSRHQRDTDAERNHKGLMHRIMLCQHNISTDADKGQRRQNKAVQETDPCFLEYQLRLLFSSQFLIHENTDRDSKGLGSDVAGHVENQRLEAHEDCKLRDNRLKHTHNTRNDEAESQQKDKPRKPLPDTVLQRFLQVFLCGKTGELCVILAHLIIGDLRDIRCGDGADDTVVLGQNRNGFLRIFLQRFETVIHALIRIDIRIVGRDDVLEPCIRPCNDKVLEIYRTVIDAVRIQHEENGNIVVLCCLGDDGRHRFLYGEGSAQSDKIRRHPRTDQLFIVGCERLELCPRFRIHQLQPCLFL